MGNSRHWNRQLCLVAALAVGVAHLSVGGRAAQWTSPTNGSFQNSARWSPAGVPGASDTAEFVHAGTYTVDFSSNATTDRLVVTGGEVTFDLNQRTYSALKPTGVSFLPASLHINGSSAPSLTITEGLLEIRSAVLGEGANNSGTLSISGAGAQFDAKEILFLGQGGVGHVIVRNGATGVAKGAYVGITSDGTNDISAIGAGSHFTITDQLVIGNFGGRGAAGALLGGQLVIGELLLASGEGSLGQLLGHSGGHVHVLGDALLGSAAGDKGGEAQILLQEFGTITIDGALKYDHNSRLQINGTLDVGSMVRMSDQPHNGGFAAWNSGALRVRSDVTTFDLGFTKVDGGSQLQVDGDLHFDSRRPFVIDESGALVKAGSISGNGQFDFTAGELQLGTLTLGNQQGQRGSLALVGQVASTPQLKVAGATDIQQGGSLSLSKAKATFDGIVVNSGSFHINQSQVAFNGTGDFGFQGLVSSHSLSIADSTIAGTVATGPGSGFEVRGEVTFNGPVKTQVDITHPAGVEPPQLDFESELHIGGVAGQTLGITIEANVALGPDSKLLLEVGGTGPGEYDTLEVEGVVTLGGTLEVSLLSGFAPSLGDSFQLITADRLLGNFAHLVLPTLPGGLEFDLGRIERGELVVLSGLEGDYNNDGTVDAVDYTVWRNALGSVSVAMFNDSSPGVGIDDYERWKSAYGTTLSEAAVLVARVPEPTSVVPMLVLLLLAWGVGTQRHLLTTRA